MRILVIEDEVRLCAKCSKCSLGNSGFAECNFAGSDLLIVNSEKTLFKIHGCPKTIVYDRDPLFMSKFWKEFLRLQGKKTVPEFRGFFFVKEKVYSSMN